MKEILKKFYKIDIDNYINYNEGAIFYSAGIYYYLCKCLYEEEYINYISNITYRINIKLHELIKNINGSFKSDQYVLLKLNYFIDDITLDDIKKYSIRIEFQDYINIKKYMLNKIDYYEDKLSDKDYNYDYYSGIVELLLSYLPNEYSGPLYLQHKKLYMDTVEFYNPLNITIDLYLRDIASYIVKTNNIDMLYKINLNEYERIYLLCRLTIPYKYFELLDEYLETKVDDKVVEYINNYKIYEKYINKIDRILNTNIFTWLKKE